MSTAPTTASSSAPFTLRTRFVYDECAAEKILTVEGRDGFFRFRVILDFRETKSPRLPSKTVAKQRKRIRLHRDFRK
jgi:hypothetical protein